MADGDDGGLFSIAISDSEDETTCAKKERGGQTEEEFQALRATYRPKIENGEVRCPEHIGLLPSIWDGGSSFSPEAGQPPSK